VRKLRRGRRSAFGRGAAGAALILVLLPLLDLSSNAQMVGLASAALSIPFVNPPPKNNGDKRLLVSPVPFFVRLKWGDGLPHDIDLWISCHNVIEGKESNFVTIGFNRKSVGWLDLLRDDQGGPSYLNEEQAQSNSEINAMPANTTCRVNVHLYNSHGGTIPVDAEIIVIQDKDGDDETLVGDAKIKLVVPGQEITAIVASWDGHGNLVKNSVQKFPDAPFQSIATLPSSSSGGPS